MPAAEQWLRKVVMNPFLGLGRVVFVVGFRNGVQLGDPELTGGRFFRKSAKTGSGSSGEKVFPDATVDWETVINILPGGL